MRVLVTGASGFVAPYVISELINYGTFEIYGSSLLPESLTVKSQNILIHPCDLSNADQVANLLNKVQPDAIIHLAGYSDVGKSWQDRGGLWQGNILATGHLAHAAAKMASNNGKRVIFVLASSATVYSHQGSKSDVLAVDENSAIQALSPYSESKLACELISNMFSSDLFKVYIVRPFNHTGPGQTTQFACPAFVNRVVAAKDGSTIQVGNLDAIKDFSDVRDIARAYALLLVKQPQQKLFVIGSGQSFKMADILQKIIALSGKKIVPQEDGQLLRSEHGAVIANAALARNVLGWVPKFDFFEDTLPALFNASVPNKSST